MVEFVRLKNWKRWNEKEKENSNEKEMFKENEQKERNSKGRTLE